MGSSRGSTTVEVGPSTSRPDHVVLRPVLIADDDPTSAALIDSALRTCHLVNPRLLAEDGDRAVALLEEGLSKVRACPALVLLDMQMPGRSGLQVLAWMRAQPALVQTPVVLLTADGDRGLIRDAYALGASSYLIKPVGFTALAEVLRGMAAPWALT